MSERIGVQLVLFFFKKINVARVLKIIFLDVRLSE
jgi:hypothetical protein